jgi:NTP pyrophosphatase (non-canonical NTP hydrolase)
MSIRFLQDKMVEQLVRRGFYPVNENEVMLRLMEEVGEVAEALREEKSLEELGSELVDVLWNVMRMAELKGIDLDNAFDAKWKFNETR